MYQILVWHTIVNLSSIGVTIPKLCNLIPPALLDVTMNEYTIKYRYFLIEICGENSDLANPMGQPGVPNGPQKDLEVSNSKCIFFHSNISNNSGAAEVVNFWVRNP